MDNVAADFRYISRRLTRHIVQRHFAHTGDWTVDSEVGVPPLKLAFRRTPPDYSNYTELALRATEYVSDSTGSLWFPGEFVVIELDFELRELQIAGWKTGDGRSVNRSIAGFFADEDDIAGIGRVFIALFGSMENLDSWNPGTGDVIGGYVPSDAGGLTRILQSHLEVTNVQPSMDNGFYERRENGHQFLDDARLMTIAPGHILGRERLLVLAKLFPSFPQENVEVQSPSEKASLPQWRGSGQRQIPGLLARSTFDHYDMAIVGTPIWARTPDPVSVAEYLDLLTHPILPEPPVEFQRRRRKRLFSFKRKS